jgi:hypothetical protein
VGTLLYPRTGVGLAPSAPDYADAGAFGLVGGVILGFGVGYILEQEYVKYDPSQLTNKQKLINLLLGLAIALVIFIPLEYLLEINNVFYRFFRYALVAFLISYLVPLICVKINK